MNPLRAKWQNDECTIGAWLSIPSPVTAEIIGRAGFDHATVDVQHGMVDYADALAMFQAIELGEQRPARAGHVERAGNHRADAGPGRRRRDHPHGQQSRRRHRRCRLLPVRPRRAAQRRPHPRPHRPSPTTSRDVDDWVLCIPMIETAEAVDNIDDILSVPGIDAVYVGPSDLAVSMGVGGPGLHNDHPAFSEALAKVVDSCRRHGVVPGIHTNVDLVARRREEGFRLMTVLIDVPTLQIAVGDHLADARAKTSR